MADYPIETEEDHNNWEFHHMAGHVSLVVGIFRRNIFSREAISKSRVTAYHPNSRKQTHSITNPQVIGKVDE